MNIFDRYAPFIQDFIYRNNWQSLRAIQVAAGDAIFNTDSNLLLCASTASGKTEAAFFPILTLLSEDPPASVGVLYIGPLKALINDQFSRLNDLCEEAGIPVWHWHGDVPQSHKNKLLRHPSGILQITPESLEALMLHKHAAIGKLFGDLRFVVIDEVHSLMRGDRGGQTLCLLERLSRLAGCNPRRVGLSATIGDLEATGRFLASGTGRGTVIPRVQEKKQVWRLSMEHFYISGPQASDPERRKAAGQPSDAADDSGEEIIDAYVIPAVQPESAGPRGGGNAAPEYGANPGAERGGNQGAESGWDTAPKTGTAVGTESEGNPGAGSEGSQSAGSQGSLSVDFRGGNGTDSRNGQSGPLPVLAAATDRAPVAADPGIGYIFEHTRGKKCLVFCNSREEAEAVTTTLRQYCEAKHEPDRFLIHHGNLSPSLRESAEELMKDEDASLTTVTTSTLELGIDIGRLERAFQLGAPFTVSSFLQRMGRTGRRGDPPEMWFVMREDPPEPRAMLPENVPWDLIQGIALVQVYLEERWVEPPRLDRMPYSLLYHQTMSTLAGGGEMSPAELAGRVLSLSYFHRISADDYRVLLNHLIEIDHIQQTERGGLIVGLAGERITNSYKFYAVFQENEEYTVRSDSEELGTLVQPPPPGEKIAIAGHVWVVEEVDRARHNVYCHLVKGKVPAYFGECPGDIHTHILERMRGVLAEQKSYPYLMQNAEARLAVARNMAAHSGLLENPLISLGGNMWALFPWLGTYAFLALERFLRIRCGAVLGIKGFDSARPYYIQFTMKTSPAEFFEIVTSAARQPLTGMDLLYPKEEPYFDKYDEFVPVELLRKGFACSVLDVEGMLKRVRSWERFVPGRLGRGPSGSGESDAESGTESVAASGTESIAASGTKPAAGGGAPKELPGE
ncbi:MAG: DEAD/DEAH box helicase [Lachnospiraceae bacterium]|jgi:ATP-dependent Lhr-like helicase